MEANQFYQLLTNCASQDVNIMQNAQKMIFELRDANMSSFFVNCILAVTQDSNLDPQARQMAALIFKNQIKESMQQASSQNEKQGWLLVDEPTRNQIKQGLMTLLGNSDPAQVKNASVCLAIVACCEVPLNMWDDFIPNMVKVATQEGAGNSDHKFAAMMTLGFISEDLEGTSLSKELVHQILYATISNISKDPQNLRITQIASGTLMRTISQTKGCYDTEDHHNYIIEKGIFQCMEINDFETQMSAYNSLLELPYVAPLEIICAYIQKIGQQTAQVIERGYSEENGRCIKALLTFWICFSEEQTQKNNSLDHIVNQCTTSLFNLVFKAIPMHELDEQIDCDLADGMEEEEKETVAQVALKLLTELVKRDCSATQLASSWSMIETFYMAELQKESWLNSYTGMQTLQFALMGINQSENSFIVFNNVVLANLKLIFSNFFSFCQNTNNAKIRYAATRLILTVCRSDAAVMILTNQELISQVYNLGKDIMQNSSEHILIQVSIAQAWAGLFIKNHKLVQDAQVNALADNYSGNTTMLVELFGPMVSTLNNLAKQPMIISSNKVNDIVEAIAEICLNCDCERVHSVMQQFLESALSLIGSLIQPNQQITLQEMGLEDQEKLEVFVNHYSALIQPIAYALGTVYKRTTGQIENKMTNEFIAQMLDLVFFIFKKFQKVSSGGLFIVHGLISGDFFTQPMRENQSQLMNEKFAELIQFLITAMNNCQQTDEMGTRLSCGLISDFCASIPEVLISDEAVLQGLLKACLNVLTSNDVEQQAKLHAVVALGDLYMSADDKQGSNQIEDQMFDNNQSSLTNKQQKYATAQRVFLELLPNTLTCFQGAAQLSLSSSEDASSLEQNEEELEIFRQLREAIVEGYISVLHGLDSLQNQDQSSQFKFQIVFYLEALCNKSVQDLNLSSEIVCNIVDLYCDLYFLMADNEQTKNCLVEKPELYCQIEGKLIGLSQKQTDQGKNSDYVANEERFDNLKRVRQNLQNLVAQGGVCQNDSAPMPQQQQQMVAYQQF